MNFMLCIGVHRARFNAFEDLVRIQDAQLSLSPILRFWECPCEGTEGLTVALNTVPILRLASLFKETEE
jgi:hypothetical protein